MGFATGQNVAQEHDDLRPCAVGQESCSKGRYLGVTDRGSLCEQHHQGVKTGLP
jgi:hypothetical protein